MSLCRAARVSGIALAATLFFQACGPKVAPAPPPPPPPGQPPSTGYICDKNNPGPITIPVTVANHATDTTKCAAAAPDAVACRDQDVKWDVTNNCSKKIKVSVGFDPFDDGDQRLTTGWLAKDNGRDTIRKKVRNNVRKSKDTPAPSFKYDIFIRYDKTQNYELTTDPEIEIDY